MRNSTHTHDKYFQYYLIYLSCSPCYHIDAIYNHDKQYLLFIVEQLYNYRIK
jgi:hypothetical protein